MHGRSVTLFSIINIDLQKAVNVLGALLRLSGLFQCHVSDMTVSNKILHIMLFCLPLLKLFLKTGMPTYVCHKLLCDQAVLLPVIFYTFNRKFACCGKYIVKHNVRVGLYLFVFLSSFLLLIFALLPSFCLPSPLYNMPHASCLLLIQLEERRGRLFGFGCSNFSLKQTIRKPVLK